MVAAQTLPASRDKAAIALAQPRGKASALESAASPTASPARRWSITATAAAAAPQQQPASPTAAAPELARILAQQQLSTAPASPRSPHSPVAAAAPEPASAPHQAGPFHSGDAQDDDAAQWLAEQPPCSPRGAGASLLKTASRGRGGAPAALALSRAASTASELPRRVGATIAGGVRSLRGRMARLVCTARPAVLD